MDVNKPLVSIGIPTFNRAILLNRSIESALNQDYRNIEVIVSDNASKPIRFFVIKEKLVFVYSGAAKRRIKRYLRKLVE